MSDSQARNTNVSSPESSSMYVESYQANNNNKECYQASKLHSFGVRLPKSLIEEFHHFVISRHGQLWKNQSIEVANALELYMDMCKTQGHTNTKSVKIHPTTHEKHTKICNILYDLPTYPKVNVQVLKREISIALQPCDGRTIRKYYDQVKFLSKEEKSDFGSLVFNVTKYVERFIK